MPPFGRHVLGPCLVLGVILGVPGSGFRVQDGGFRVPGSGFRVQGSGFRVQGSGHRIQGSGFRVQGLGLRGGCRVLRGGRRVQDLKCRIYHAHAIGPVAGVVALGIHVLIAASIRNSCSDLIVHRELQPMKEWLQMCSGSEAGSYLRLADSGITQLQGLPRACRRSSGRG